MSLPRAAVVAGLLLTALAGGSRAQDGTAAPASPAETFLEAGRAYEAGDAAKAAQLYQSLVERGYGSAELFYNLGNAELRQGELGLAIASYLRSRAISPRDQDVAANLAFARKSSEDAIAPPAPSALLSTLFFWHYQLSRSELALATVLLNLLFWGLLAVRLLRPGSELLRWALPAAGLLLLAAFLSLALRHLSPTRIAVVVPAEINAHNSPDPTAAVRFLLHAGTELPVRERREGWLRIALPDGQQGWIQAAEADVVAD